MVFVNYADRKVICKIVYCGTGESGKTTNLTYIYNKIDNSIRSDLTTLQGLNERTLFFDFLSIDLGKIKDFDTSFSLFTAPGQEQYNAARKIILNGVDGIIFVADSRVEKRQDNIDSLNNIKEILKSYNLSFDTIPIIFQYNKRDIVNILPMETLERELNSDGCPSFEATANDGTGVFACLKSMSNRILTSLQ